MSAIPTGEDLKDAAARVAHLRPGDVFPFLRELKGYKRETARADLLAGATVALVSIPQAIGFALIAGLPPLMVMMSVIVGGFVCALLTSSQHLVFGPTNSISMLLAAVVLSFGASGLTGPGLVLLMGLLIGVIQLAGGLSQLGKLTQFISRAVIIGYSTAIGLLLAASQLPHLLGVVQEPGGIISGLGTMLARMLQLDFNPYAMVMGVTTLLVFDVIARLVPRVPAELVGLVFLALVTKYGGLGTLEIRTIGDIGALTASLPSFTGLPLHNSDPAVVIPMLGSALAIALLGMLEAVSIAKTLAAKSGQRIDPNRELVAMGAANIVSCLFGGMPGSASFARSGANLQSRGQTQMSALSSSLMVLVMLLFVAPLINFIPVPSLAAHLIRIGLRMINRDHIRVACRTTHSDTIVFAVTLLSAMFLRLETAIYIGIGVSVALFLRKASAPSLVEYAFNASGNLAAAGSEEERRNTAVSIIHVEGELFFGAADIFQEQVRELAKDGRIRVFILRMKNARHIDLTSVFALEQLLDYLERNGRHLLISGINKDGMRVLRRSGLLARIGEENVFPAEVNPTVATRRALLRATHLLQTSAKPEIRIFYDSGRSRAEDQAGDGGPGTDEYQI